jgi:hypothetical protein
MHRNSCILEPTSSQQQQNLTLLRSKDKLHTNMLHVSSIELDLLWPLAVWTPLTYDNNMFCLLYTFLMEDSSQTSYSSAKTRPRGSSYANIRIDCINCSWKGYVSLPFCLFSSQINIYHGFSTLYCVQIILKFCICSFRLAKWRLGRLF